jgi:hypothetical protein
MPSRTAAPSLSREEQKRLAAIPAKYKGKKSEFTESHLQDLVSPRNSEALVQALEKLSKEGKLKKVFRVVSRNGGGIKDFPSREEIPMEIHDWRDDVMVQTDDENIRIVYQAP